MGYSYLLSCLKIFKYSTVSTSHIFIPLVSTISFPFCHCLLFEKKKKMKKKSFFHVLLAAQRVNSWSSHRATTLPLLSSVRQRKYLALGLWSTMKKQGKTWRLRLKKRILKPDSAACVATLLRSDLTRSQSLSVVDLHPPNNHNISFMQAAIQLCVHLYERISEQRQVTERRIMVEISKGLEGAWFYSKLSTPVYINKTAQRQDNFRE